MLGLVRASLSLPRGIRSRAADSIDRTAERLETCVDDVLSLGLHNLNIATVEDVQRLERRLEELGDRVDDLLRAQGGGNHCRSGSGGRRSS